MTMESIQSCHKLMSYFPSPVRWECYPAKTTRVNILILAIPPCDITKSRARHIGSESAGIPRIFKARYASTVQVTFPGFPNAVAHDPSALCSDNKYLRIASFSGSMSRPKAWCKNTYWAVGVTFVMHSPHQYPSGRNTLLE
jgi:hypothetical protein